MSREDSLAEMRIRKNKECLGLRDMLNTKLDKQKELEVCKKVYLICDK